MDSYRHKTIWIVGASSGIGSALAKKLSQRGAQLILSARQEDKLQEVLQSCEGQEKGRGHIIAPFDVGDHESVQRCFKELRNQEQEIDSVVFLAAIYSDHSVQPKEISFIHKMINVNIGGAYNLLDVVLPYYKQKNSGQIAICGSVAGYRGLPTGQPYCSTKAALINLCESLHVDMKSTNIDVKLISPGFVKTPLTDKNDFLMPMIIEADKAAQYIADGLLRKKFEICFPKIFIFFMKILRILPNVLYFFVARRLR